MARKEAGGRQGAPLVLTEHSRKSFFRPSMKSVSAAQVGPEEISLKRTKAGGRGSEMRAPSRDDCTCGRPGRAAYYLSFRTYQDSSARSLRRNS